MKTKHDFKHPSNSNVSYNCSEYDGVFNTKSPIERHLVKHTDRKCFNYIECGKSFKRKESLHYHMGRYTGITVYQRMYKAPTKAESDLIMDNDSVDNKAEALACLMKGNALSGILDGDDYDKVSTQVEDPEHMTEEERTEVEEKGNEALVKNFDNCEIAEPPMVMKAVANPGDVGAEGVGIEKKVEQNDYHGNVDAEDVKRDDEAKTCQEKVDIALSENPSSEISDKQK